MYHALTHLANIRNHTYFNLLTGNHKTKRLNGIVVFYKWPVGLLKNQATMTSDFDEPLPDDLIDAFEGKYKNV